MAAVQPRVAPRWHPSPNPPLVPAAPSQAPAARPHLPCKRSRPDATVAVAHGRKEKVAESCCPSSRLDLDQLELVLVDDDSGEEEDGCGSCVDGAGGASAGQDEEEEEEESGSRCVAWWGQDSCSLWANGSRATEAGHQLRAGGESDDDEDPAVAAARRQEEDRKFWEACLASGYP